MDEHYITRCLELAAKGLGSVAPNPMVGCVIVHDDIIIGEGYHRAFGEAHAEVNAIASVKDPRLLDKSTLYVNLEPCSHIGKTPACTNLITERKIPRLVVGAMDPNPLVAGAGIRMLKEKGLEVRTGVLEEDCLELNKRFIAYHQKKRPYIILKWARTKDGYIDRQRQEGGPEGINWITGSEARQWVHKWRSEEQAVLVGTRTALLDNPQLTVRHWKGRDPLRLVIDRERKLPRHLNIFNGDAETIVYTSNPEKGHKNVNYFTIPSGTNYIPGILTHLYEIEIQSLIVEGGAGLLNSFIQSGIWDEARVFTGDVRFGEGIPSPVISGKPVRRDFCGNDLLEIYGNP